MTGRKLAGDLSQLSVTSLLRLLEATTASGVLDLEGPGGEIRLRVADGRAVRPDSEALRTFERMKTSGEGRFRFVVDESLDPGPDAMTLAELAALGGRETDIGEESGSAGASEVVPEGREGGPSAVHHLGDEIAEDPLADLIQGLEEVAPDELRLAEIGIVASNPTVWRGSLAAAWRRRGWNLELIDGPAAADPQGLDVLIVHHHLSVTRVGHENDWIDLLERASAASPPARVVWVGPLTDPRWVRRLVASDVAFLLPPPPGESGPPLERFMDTVAEVIDRLLQRRSPREDWGLASRIADVLLPDGGPGEGMAALLHVASGCLRRAAVLDVAATHVRCRAGVGYPIHQGIRVLPRGIGLIERVVRDGEVVNGVPSGAAGVDRLADLVGVDSLPENMCLIPLVVGHRVAGMMIGDCDGRPLPEIDELVHIGRWLGGLLDS